MKIANKMKFLAGLLVFFSLVVFATLTTPAYAATSPTLVGSSGYSVLGGAAITNVGTTNTNGAVGVSPGSSIAGGTINAGGGIHSNDASAIAAQADTVNVFTALNAGANADANCIGGILASNTDLTAQFPAGVGPGLYCSAGSFRLTGTLNLIGSSGVWVFKTVSTLITSPGSSVTGGDPCNVWWRIGSAATLDTTTSFIGNIVVADAAGTTAMNGSATLNGRILAQAAHTVTLSSNTITGPVCTVAATPTPTSNGFGLPGDNQSDHRSDGRSSPPAISATTKTLAATGSNDQSIRIILAATAALSVFLLGKTLLRRNETS